MISSIYDAAEDDDVVGCTPLQLAENHWIEIQNLIEILPETISDQNKSETNYERFQKLIELYHEQPRLLDSVLVEMVEKLLQFVDFPMDKELSKLTIAALVRLRVLTTVRGYMAIIKLLPHEVNYLEKLLLTLEFYVQQSKSSPYPQRCVNQEALYMLVVWLMITCKNPFNLAMFDSAKSRAEGTKTTTERILDCLQVFREWYSVDLRMKIVPMLMSQIITRNENNTPVLHPLIYKSLEILQKTPVDEKETFKELLLLVAIFKRGKRAELLKYAKPVIDRLTNLLKLDSQNTYIRNYTVKLVQRLTLVFLKPRLAKWRYLCGVRSLEQNLAQPTGIDNIGNQPNLHISKILEIEEWYTQEKNLVEAIDEEEEEEEDDGEEIPYEEVEIGINCVLTSICDKENEIRWSGAKGLGRICVRLPKELGDMVITQILVRNFKEYAPAGVWHGGCLALAELSRRGCLLPKRLEEVLEVLEKALRFNERHGNFSASVNVRDAACYICWAFARAYETQILAPYMKPMAKNLICVALFDREVNVRRAASAAFQENVGRHGNIPHGIEINTILEFIAVGIRKRCYLELSTRVAELNVPELVPAMLDFLADFQAIHWDEKIRVLASEALKSLTKFDTNYAIEKLISRIYSRISSPFPDYKHGSLFALSGILEGLVKANSSLDINCLIPKIEIERLIAVVTEIYPQIISKRTSGVGLLMKGLCRYIQAMAYVKVDLKEEQLQEWTNVLDLIGAEENIVYHEMVQNGYKNLFVYYKENMDVFMKRINEKYFEKLKSRDLELDRVGAILPFACIPQKILTQKIPFFNDSILAFWIFDRLIEVIKDQSTPTWTSARVVAINTLASVASEINLLYALDDYTKTAHGDVGNFVRKAAISAFGVLFPKFYEKPENFERFQEILDLSIQKILKQCCEIMDWVRMHAALTMSNLVTYSHIPIKNKDVLIKVFRKNPDGTDEDFKKLWIFEGFSRMEPLFEVDVYRKFVLMGFVFCAGNLIQSSNRSAYIVLRQHAKSMKDDFEKTERLLEDFYKIFNEIKSMKDSQVVFLNLIQSFFIERAFPAIEEHPDDSPGFKNIADLVISIAISKGTPKVKSLALTTLSSFLQVDSNSKIWFRVLMIMISFLTSKYPTLRSRSAQHLYEALSGLDEPEYSDEGMQQVLLLLSDNAWATAETENQDKLNEVAKEISENLKKLYEANQ